MVKPPVHRAAAHLAHHKVQREQPEGRGRGQPARLFHALQVAQPPAEEEIERHAGDDEDDLLEHVVRRAGGADLHAQRGEEEGQRLRLEARAAQRAHEEVAEPLRRHQRQDGEADDVDVFLRRRHHELQRQEALEEREDEERHARAHIAPGGGAAALKALALGVGDAAEGGGAAGEVDLVAVAHVLPAAGLLAVDEGAALAAQVGQRPVPGPVALQRGVHPRDGGVREHDVRRARPADDALPVVHRVFRAVQVHDIGPGLRLVAPAQHGAHAAEQYPQREQRQYIFRPLHDVYAHIRQVFHPIPPVAAPFPAPHFADSIIIPSKLPVDNRAALQ